MGLFLRIEEGEFWTRLGMEPSATHSERKFFFVFERTVGGTQCFVISWVGSGGICGFTRDKD